MRNEDNSAYNRDEDNVRRWNYRYTMVTIIAVLVIVAAALVVFDNGNNWIAEEDNIDYGNRIDDEYYIIGEGDMSAVQPVPTVDSRDEPTPEPQGDRARKRDTVSPIKGGTISKGFSHDDLIYSDTLDQYVVHLGVDIEAAPDTSVNAVKGGTVTKVYNDDKLGITIEINHGDGYVTRYSSLSTDRMVEEGDVVETGDVISGVGITALFESSDPPHLHFEVLKDGEPINPAQFVTIE